MHFGITFPSYNRASKVKRLITSLQDNTPDCPHKISWIIGLNTDEPDMEGYYDLKNVVRDNDEIIFIFLDKWKGLGYAFNYISEHMPEGPETITMFGDDMIFNEDAPVILNTVKEYLNSHPSKIGVVSFNQASPLKRLKNRHIAINGFMHRNWYKALGMMIPEAYTGNGSDRWLSDLALKINRYKYCEKLTIPHLHFTFNRKHKDKTASQKVKWDKQNGKGFRRIHKQEYKKMPVHMSKLINFMKGYE